MPPGRFRVYQDQQDPQDIHFETLPDADAGPIPQDQLDLKDDVERTLTVLRAIFPEGDVRFGGYFRQLLSLAQTGLVGEHANAIVGKQALSSLKNDITIREGGRIKNKYMRMLGIRALVLGSPALAVALALHLLPGRYDFLQNFLGLWAGCCAGVWLSFGTRKNVLQFEDLAIPEEDRMEPAVRLIFAGLLTIILGLAFSLDALNIEVGNASASKITEDFRLAVLVGALCGVGERMLSTRVTQLASSLLETR